MGIYDALLEFEPLTGTAVTTGGASTNTIDMSQNVDLGYEYPLFIEAKWITVPTAAGAATVNVQYQGSVDNATWATIEETGAQLISTQTAAGFEIWRTPVPASGALYRYYRLNYVVATGPLTGGTIFAGMTLGVTQTPGYPRNYVS
jgi:hypothetical protein